MSLYKLQDMNMNEYKYWSAQLWLKAELFLVSKEI